MIKKNKTLIISAVVVLLVGAGAFYAGMRYQQSQRGAFGRQGQFQANLGRNGNNRPVAGQVISSDDKSITVKMMDGSTKIVLLSDSTTVTEATSAGKQALQTGKQVLVVGTQNSDGSVTATNVQIGGGFQMRTGAQGPRGQ